MAERENSDPSKDIQIHIHEHVAPIRERMSRIEGRIDGNERELALLRQSLDSLRDRIDGMRDALLTSIEDHQEVAHKRIERLADAQQVCAERLEGLRNWVIGIGGGLGGGLLLLQAFKVMHGGLG